MATVTYSGPIPTPSSDLDRTPQDGLERFRTRIQSLLSRRLAKGQTISTDDAAAILAIASSILAEER